MKPSPITSPSPSSVGAEEALPKANSYTGPLAKVLITESGLRRTGPQSLCERVFLRLVAKPGTVSEFGWGNVLHPDDAEATIKLETLTQTVNLYREHRFPVWMASASDPGLRCPVRNEAANYFWAALTWTLAG